MPRKKIGFDTVRQMGLALPGVEERTVYGSPAMKVRGKMFAYPVVLVRLTRVNRDALRDLLLMGWRFVSTGSSGGAARASARFMLLTSTAGFPGKCLG
jgi:hypothetical protein